MRIALLIAAIILIILFAALVIADFRWRARTANLVAHLHARGADLATPPTAFSASAARIDTLPAPVARYFRAVLREGQPIARRWRLTQEGEFLLNAERSQWGPFTGTQHVVAEPPGFVWDARIRMAPGLTAFVRDGFVNGTGSMMATLRGILRVAAVEGTPEIAAGAIHRYLAEAVWCPTLLLPSPQLSWTPLDESSARATLSAGDATVWLDFRFRAEDGLIESVYTPERFRDVNGRGVPTPWQGRFSDYEERGGMRIPLAGEVEWVLPDGPQAYWRGRIIAASYE